MMFIIHRNKISHYVHYSVYFIRLTSIAYAVFFTTLSPMASLLVLALPVHDDDKLKIASSSPAAAPHADRSLDQNDAFETSKLQLYIHDVFTEFTSHSWLRGEKKSKTGVFDLLLSINSRL